MTERDEYFMRRAIALAEKGMNSDSGGPFGAVVVKNDHFASTRADAAEIEFDDHFIYDELDKNIDERKITFVNILREEALPVFQKWEEKNNKTKY